MASVGCVVQPTGQTGIWRGWWRKLPRLQGRMRVLGREEYRLAISIYASFCGGRGGETTYKMSRAYSRDFSV